MEVFMRLKGYIYVIGNDELGLFKIGFSRNHPAEGRLRHLQVGSPVILRLVTSIYVENAPKEEARLHEQFVEKHVHYEWYRLSPEDLKAIGGNLPVLEPEKKVSLSRTLSTQEAKIILTLEEQGKRRTNRSEIIRLLEGTPSAADNVIESLRNKGWLERVTWGQYKLIPFDQGQVVESSDKRFVKIINRT